MVVPAGEVDVLRADARDRVLRVLALPLAREAADEHERRAAAEAGAGALVGLDQQRDALDLGEAADVEQHRRVGSSMLDVGQRLRPIAPAVDRRARPKRSGSKPFGISV